MNRWHDVLNPSIDRVNALVSSIDPTTARAGIWTAAEDSKTKHAVQTHGANDWVAISLLVPGRTKSQCRSRWKNASTLN
jgi:hypothetical protein